MREEGKRQLLDKYFSELQISELTITHYNSIRRLKHLEVFRPMS